MKMPDKRKKELMVKIKTLFLRGWTTREIAESLNYTQRQVEMYIREIRAQMKRDAEVGELNDKQAIAGEIDWQFREILKHCWNAYNKADSVRDKMACLDRVMESISSRIHQLQSIGEAPIVEKGKVADLSVVYISKLGKEEQTVKTNEELKQNPS